MRAETVDPTDLRGEPERIKVTRVQRMVAERMLAATTQVPSFTLRGEVDLEPVLALRADWDREDPGRPTVNDYVVRAAALALREHRSLNASWSDGCIERFARINIGIAVAADGLLMVPTVLDADRRGVAELARETRRLIDAVHERRITPAELSGATFSVSNLGMYGIADFDAIIAVPQAAMLAVSAGRKQPVVRGTEVVPGIVMGLRLSCDHRVVYGADGAAFIRSLCGFLAQPSEWAS